MTNRPDLDAIRELRRNISTILAGHDQPIVGTALVTVTADWLRQYNHPDVTDLQRDQLRIALLMRFIKGVAEELSLGIEGEQLDEDDKIRFDA